MRIQVTDMHTADEPVRIVTVRVSAYGFELPASFPLPRDDCMALPWSPDADRR